MNYDCVIVGAGLTGISAARYLADKGKHGLVIEQTNRIGGLCKEGHFKGIRFSLYGPHIFHTNNKEVWDFLSQFTDWEYFNSAEYVKSYCSGKLWTVPIDYSEFPENSWAEGIAEMSLYEDYTKKMWGKYYKEMKDKSIKRLNIGSGPRWDKRYFKDKYQAFPASGYDEMLMKMTDHKNIEILLTSPFSNLILNNLCTDKIPIIYTGRIDKLLDKAELPFMTMGFEIVLNGSFPWSDKYGVINFPQDFDFIRAHSSKILYKQDTKNDVVVYEYPGRSGIECYPIVYEGSLKLWEDIYKGVWKKYPNIIPAGRAGMFQYMNMDEAVCSGIYAAKIVLEGSKVI